MRGNQRCIGKHDDGDAVTGADAVPRCGNGITGAILIVLDRERGTIKPGLNVLAVRRKHCDNPLRPGGHSSINGPGKHGPPPDLMERLGQCGSHPRSLAGRKDNGCKTHDPI